MNKLLFCGLLVLLMIVVTPVSANHLSVRLITAPEPVAPGESFSLNILLNHNGNGYFVDHSDTIITFDPTYVTIDPDQMEALDNPWELGGGCSLDENEIYCGSGEWYFPELVRNTLFFKNPIIGKIKDNTPIGTKVEMSVCTIGTYDSENIEGIEACDNSHFITVAKKSEVPEFPIPALPAIMIIGVLGAVLSIRRTREH